MKKIADLFSHLSEREKNNTPYQELEVERIKSEIEYLRVRNSQGDDMADSIRFLQFLTDMIKIDIMSDTSLNGILRDSRFKESSISIPLECKDQNGNIVKALTDQKRELNFEQDYVVTNVWNEERMFRALKDVQKNGFIYDEWNHKAYYYDGMDLFYVYHGNHHTQAACYFKTGKMMADICNVRVLFDHMETDSGYWINIHTGEKIDKVEDFRVAMLYELCKFLDQLKEKQGCVTNDTF